MHRRSWAHPLSIIVALLAIVLLGRAVTSGAGTAARRFTGPTSSQPLALSADDSLLAVANPDNDTVTFFGVHDRQATRLDEVQVGQEPSGVAVLPDGSKAYAANTVSGTVSVMRIDSGRGRVRVLRHINVGTE